MHTMVSLRRQCGLLIFVITACAPSVSAVGQLPLSKWLADKTLRIPHLTLVIPAAVGPSTDDLVMKLTNLTCTGLDIPQVTMPSIASDTKSFSAALQIQGLGITACSSDASVDFGSLHSDSIRVKMSLADTAVKLGMNISFDSSTVPLPESVQLTPGSCHFDVNFAQLAFSGEGTLPSILNDLIVPFLGTKVGKDLLDSTACDLAQDVLAINGTAFLKRLMNKNTTKPAVPRTQASFDVPVLHWEKTLGHNPIPQAVWAFVVDVMDIHSKLPFTDKITRMLGWLGLHFPPHFPGPLVLGNAESRISLANIDCSSMSLGNFKGNVSNVAMFGDGQLGMNCSVDVTVSTPTLLIKPMRLAVNVGTADISVGVALALRPDFLSLHLDQMQRPPCVLNHVAAPHDFFRSGAELLNYGLSLDRLELKAGVGPDADHLVAAIFPIIAQLVSVGYGSFGQTLTALLTGETVSELVVPVINGALATSVSAPHTCPDTVCEPGSIEGLDTVSVKGSIVLGILAAVVASFTAVMFGGKTLKKTCANRSQAPINHPLTANEDAGPAARESPPAYSGPVPLCSSPKVSRPVSLLILVLLLLNVAVFLMANALDLIDIFCKTWVGEEVQVSPAIFSFGTWNSAVEFARAGCWPLAFFAVAWTMCWPFVKVFALLSCWVLSPKVLKVSWRENMLVFLDQVGKFSIFDCLMMCVLIVGFQFDWQGQDSNGQNTRILMAATPEPGFFFLILGTILSLVLGEIILHFHRAASQFEVAFHSNIGRINSTICSTIHSQLNPGSVAPSGLDASLADGSMLGGTPERHATLSDLTPASSSERQAHIPASTPERLGTGRHLPAMHTGGSKGSANRLSHMSSTNSVRSVRSVRSARSLTLRSSPEDGIMTLCQLAGASTRMKVCVACGVVVSLALFVVGCFVRAFHFDWGGGLGALYDVMGRETQTDFTFPGWVIGMKPTAMDDNKLPMNLVFVGAWTMIFVLPLFNLASLVILWFVPLQSKWQYRLFTMSQIFGAWALLDVAVLACMVAACGGATFGVERLVHVMLHNGAIKPIADALKSLLNIEMAVFGPTLDYGMWMLLVAAMGIDVIGIYIYRNVQRILKVQ